MIRHKVLYFCLDVVVDVDFGVVLSRVGGGARHLAKKKGTKGKQAETCFYWISSHRLDIAAAAAPRRYCRCCCCCVYFVVCLQSVDRSGLWRKKAGALLAAS